jgi:hypothetical protein
MVGLASYSHAHVSADRASRAVGIAARLMMERGR